MGTTSSDRTVTLHLHVRKILLQPVHSAAVCFVMSSDLCKEHKHRCEGAACEL